MKSKSKKPCYASKGLPKVPGKPKGTDIIPAWLTPGEAVLSPGAAEMLGRGNVQALNRAANHMRLGSQYKALGDEDMQPEMQPEMPDLAGMGNARADEILSNPDQFTPEEVRAAERYMDPRGLGGGPSEARDMTFLKNTRSLDQINNPMNEDTMRQYDMARNDLFGKKPQYFMNGTGMVLGMRPQYYAIGDEDVRRGRDPASTLAMQDWQVQKPAQPSRAPSFADEIRANSSPSLGSSLPKPAEAAVNAYLGNKDQGSFYAGGRAIRAGIGETVNQLANAPKQIAQNVQPYAQPALDVGRGLLGMEKASTSSTAQQNIGGLLDISRQMGQTNIARNPYEASKYNAKDTGQVMEGIMNMNSRGELSPAKPSMTASQGADGNINLSWINEAAKKAAMSLGNQRPNNQAPALDPNGANKAFYLGGMKMPFNQGDFVSYKDAGGILRGGRATANGFTNEMMNLGSMMNDPGMRAAIEAQNGIYSANKNLADANQSNAMAANAPARALYELGNAVQSGSQAGYYDAAAQNYLSDAEKNRDMIANPQKYARLGTQNNPEMVGTWKPIEGFMPEGDDPSIPFYNDKTGQVRRVNPFEESQPQSTLADIMNKMIAQGITEGSEEWNGIINSWNRRFGQPQ